LIVEVWDLTRMPNLQLPKQLRHRKSRLNITLLFSLNDVQKFHIINFVICSLFLLNPAIGYKI